MKYPQMFVDDFKICVILHGNIQFQNPPQTFSTLQTKHLEDESHLKENFCQLFFEDFKVVIHGS